MVDALNAARKDGTLSRADVAELMRQDLSELVEGVPENGPLPATWDPKHPCADALPPTTHSHTFWADGRFNSYDQTGRQVDDGTWTATTDTLTIGDWSWRYRIDGNRLALDPIVPRTSCTTPDCRFGLGWIFSVAFPGQRWTRVTSGPHVPPESAG
jgi:hypothetical protein